MITLKNIKVFQLLPGDLIAWVSDPTLVISISRVNPSNDRWAADYVQVTYLGNATGLRSCARWSSDSVIPEVVRHT